MSYMIITCSYYGSAFDAGASVTNIGTSPLLFVSAASTNSDAGNAHNAREATLSPASSSVLNFEPGLTVQRINQKTYFLQLTEIPAGRVP